MPGHACRPSSADFSVLFSEIHVNMDSDPLERPATEDTPPTGPDPTSGQLASILAGHILLNGYCELCMFRC